MRQISRVMLVSMICDIAPAGCRQTRGTRAITGGLLGAGSGAAVGSATGLGAGKGALIGGAGIAGVGALTGH
jgi:hypothetical protein